MKNKKIYFISCLVTVLFSGCASQPLNLREQSGNADAFLVVDCLLPGELRQLGRLTTYITARKAIKTTASDCAVRGGEFTPPAMASYQTAFKIWMPKAESGDPEAQAYVGEVYEKGYGREPDFEMAALWYRKAARQGNYRAQVNLGYLYEKGLGVEKDRQKAAEWYAKNVSRQNVEFTSTITTAEDGDQSSEQIRLLKTELKNSEAEKALLTKQMQDQRRQLQQNKQNVAELEQVINSIQQKMSHSSGRQQTVLANQMQEKQTLLKQAQDETRLLDEKYQRQLLALRDSLGNMEKRAQQIAEELSKQRDQSALLQVKLAGSADEKQRLKQGLETKRQQLQASQQNVADLKKVIADIRRQMATSDHQQQSKLSQLLSEKQNLLTGEQRKNQQLEQRYQQQLLALKSNISNLQAKTEQITGELQSQRDKAGQLQIKLMEAEANLASTEQQLLLQETEFQKKIDMLSADHQLRQGEQRESWKDEVEQQMAAQQQLIKQLEEEKVAFQQKMATLEKQRQQQITPEKPKIEIIDPSFIYSRGIATVKLRSLVKERELIGKVDSPAGLMTLLINDRKTKVDEYGLFRLNMNLSKQETPVEIVAVDERGQRSSLNFVFSMTGAEQMDVQRPGLPENNPWSVLNFGNYYALIIGNNKYQKVPTLDTPRADARAIDAVLKAKYGFKTQVLLDATRYEILSALNKLRSQLTENDNLLVYYAGHGELDKVNMRGHWLPVDADADNTANWISTVALTDIFNAMNSKHILVVSDSCYSGAMTRSSLARLDAGMSRAQQHDWLKAMIKTKSRTVLTSGGLKPVLDGGGGDHSVFAQAFIRALADNKGLLEGQSLYRKVSSGIVTIAAGYGFEQVPEYAPIRHSGHESGEFFFVPKI